MSVISCTERDTAPKESVPLVTIKTNTTRDDIPLAKDWANRESVMPATYKDCIEKSIHFPIRDDDVFIVTVPKCGTTWMQETAWLVFNNFDFNTAKATNILERSPHLEFTGIFTPECISHLSDSFKYAEALPSPRLVKSHLPPHLLPIGIWEKRNKIIYVTRNVKDAIVSGFHMNKAFGIYNNGTIDKFAKCLMGDHYWYAPFWDHVLEFWQMREEPNVFFTSYERMKSDLKGVLKDLCVFLEKPAPSDEILQQAYQHLQIDNIKKSEAGKIILGISDRVVANSKSGDKGFEFLRKGIVGSHKTELSKETIEEVDQWSEKHLKKAGVTSEEILEYRKQL